MRLAEIFAAQIAEMCRKGLQGYPAPVPIDDDGDDASDDERQPIEDAVDPTNGGSKPN